MIPPIIYLVFQVVLLYALTWFIIRALWYCSTLDSVLKDVVSLSNISSFTLNHPALSSAPQKASTSTGYGPCPQILNKMHSHHPNVSHVHRLDPNSGASLYAAR